MKAAVVHGPGQTPVYGDFAEPAPVAGESRIKIAAAALSRLARARAIGAHYSSSGEYPLIAGVDGVGRLDDGKRVYFALPRAPYGAFAEVTVAPSASCLPLPENLDDVTAAALANPGMSSWVAFKERAKLKAGETVLVNGATGAAGRLAVQIAKHLGAKKVIATGRNAEALSKVTPLGADVTILLGEDVEALEQRFKAEFAEDVDVVVDYLWGKSAESLLTAAAKASADAHPIRFVQIGSLSGPNITLASAALRAKTIELMGSGFGSVGPNRLIAAIRELFEAAVPAGFKVAAQAAPLAEVEKAWASKGSDRLVFVPDAHGA